MSNRVGIRNPCGYGHRGGQRGSHVEGNRLDNGGAAWAVLGCEAVAVPVDLDDIASAANLGKVVVVIVAVGVEVDGVVVEAV